MTRRFGGLLSLLLGVVFLVGGGLGMNNAAGGNQNPTCQIPVGFTTACPTGTITITEATKPDGTSAAAWTVTITSSNCTAPSGQTLNKQVSVPNNGTASSGQLFIFTNSDHATKCTYHLAETPVARFTTTYDPGQDVTIPFADDRSQTGNAPVTVTNTKAAATTSAAASSSASAASSSRAAAPVAASSAAAPLANTGTRTQISWSLFAGIALCLLGLVLLLAGRLPLPQRARGRRS